MGEPPEPTSGTPLLDDLVDGVRIGDNLVVVAEDEAVLDLLVRRYVAALRGRVPLVAVTLTHPWEGPVPEDLRVLDWSAALTGQPSPAAGALAPGADLEDALASLRTADAEAGEGAAFVIDRLGAAEQAWSGEAALELFLATCPRLYRRRSLALWPVLRSEHRPSLLRRLGEITQVVVELTPLDGHLEAIVRKADGRGSEVGGRRVRAEVAEGDLVARGPRSTARERIGTMLRRQRLAGGLSQAEVARRVGVSPSALSQMERGVRGPSGDTLIRLWEVLGVPFGPGEQPEPGYHVARRSGRERRRLQEGLVAERILDDPVTGELWLVEAAAGAAGDRSPFAAKAPEVATVVQGVLDLTIEGRTETLHEGDTLAASRSPVSGWANPGSEPARVMWAIHTGA